MWFSNMCACVSLALHYFSMSSLGFRPNSGILPNAFHELGHGVQSLSGELGSDGADQELRRRVPQRAVNERHSVASGERDEGGRHRLDVAQEEHAGADLADHRVVVVGDDGHGRAVRDGSPQLRDHVERGHRGEVTVSEGR